MDYMYDEYVYHRRLIHRSIACILSVCFT